MSSTLQSGAGWIIASAALAVCSPAYAQPARAASYRFDLPPLDLSVAVRRVALAAGANVIAPADLLAGRRSGPLSGEFTVKEALDRLLAGTGLEARDAHGALVIEAAAESRATGDDSETGTAIVVTGTHLRGAPPTSPVIVITRRQIDQAAPVSVEALMRQVPQNVSAGVGRENFDVTGAGADITDHGAGVNLRGLGQRATLVLVNGRRLAPSDSGSFVDVSLIPISAVDRVEILTDGASAIYGSDAVGGVVNFILRKDFDGFEPILQVGTTTEGGGRQLLAGATAGRHWSSGNALVSYEYRDDQPVLARDRDSTINLPSGWYLFPREKRHSLYATGRQELAGNLALDLSGMFAARHTRRSFFDAGTAVPVDADASAQSLGGTAALDLSLPRWEIEASGSAYRTRTRESEIQAGSLFNRFNTLNSYAELALKADGDLVRLPAGALKIAAGAALRREHFESLFETPVNAPTPQSGSRTVSAVYGELNLPLFAAPNARPGLRQLTLSAAGRLEHYEKLGSSFNPKVGMLWSPLAGLEVRSSYGTSFRAPLLSESLGYYNAFYFPAAFLYVDPTQAPAGAGLALAGANPDVGPERSRSFSLGAELAPPKAAGLHFSATYYAIRFSHRIALPTDQIVVVGDPSMDPIVTRNPPLDDVDRILSGAGQVIDVSGPGFTSGGAGPQDVVVIVDARIGNTAETRTSGLDLALSQEIAAGANRFRLGLDANRVFRFDDRLTSSSPVVHTLDTPYHPIGWRGRGSASWARGPFSAVLFANYAGSYRDNRGGASRHVRSFTTIDAGLAFDGSAEASSPLHRLRIALNVQNLFDRRPPRLLPDPGFSSGVGYDPVNATGLGRVVSLQLRGSW